MLALSAAGFAVWDGFVLGASSFSSSSMSRIRSRTELLVFGCSPDFVPEALLADTAAVPSGVFTASGTDAAAWVSKPYPHKNTDMMNAVTGMRNLLFLFVAIMITYKPFCVLFYHSQYVCFTAI
nr:hypothetical protein [uncultured Acetatifactor sp.]